MYQPKYKITNTILKDIGNIEASKEVIENAPLVPYYEKKFKSEAITKTVHHGTHIEGNELSLVQTKKLLEGESVVAHDRDVQEVINYRNVMKLIDDLSQKRGNYDKEMLLEIHKETVDKIVDQEKSGVFRKTQVVIKEETTGEVILRPPSHVEIPYLLDSFFEWFNSDEAKDIHPILRAGICHYILVSIHPFVEGNGRTVRAFATLVLVRENYDIKRFFSFEEYFDKDLASYYGAFSEVDKQAKNIADRDLTSWLEYFVRVVSVELSRVKDRVRRLSIDTKLKGKIGSQIALTERQMKLIEFLTEIKKAGMNELKGVLPMVSEDTILRDIKGLLKKGIIKKEGKTKAAKYKIVDG